MAAALFHREAALHFRFGLQEIGKTLYLDKVHLAIIEGAS